MAGYDNRSGSGGSGRTAWGNQGSKNLKGLPDLDELDNNSQFNKGNYNHGYDGYRDDMGHGIRRPKPGDYDSMNDMQRDDRASKGCWASFSGCIGGMWATRQIAKKEDREIYVRTTLRELIVYIIFLAILCVITFGMTSETMYYYTKVLSDLFLESPYSDTRNTFKGSTQVMDFWRFSEQILLAGLHWEYWYDHAKTPSEQDARNILYENRLLGVPRIRQLRVKSDSCTVAEQFQNVIINCYATYSYSHEDDKPFGLGNGSAWTYHTQEELDGSTYWGKLHTYSGAGSYVDLKTTMGESKEIIMELRKHLWLDRGTRAVFIDFTVYNANINLFCVIKLVVEFPPTGGIIPSSTFRTVKLLRYVSTTDYIILGCEFIFIFFIIYYIVEEMIEIANLKIVYFKSLWNILDLIVIGLALVCIFFNAYLSLTIEPKLEELLLNPLKYADFDSVSYWHSQFGSAVAICVFFSWFKLFKYISFNKTMTQLSSTLSRCAKDVAGFLVMFFIVFFAFSQLGYLLFGTQVRDFNRLINSCFTLLRTILGDFNFHEIEEANRVLGPIFFLSYVFFVFFVLLNMFLAIINDTYSEVKAEIANQREEFQIGDYFKRGYNNMMGRIGKRDKLIDIENALKLSDTNNDGMLSFEEVRVNLKKCNFSDMEIEMFFARYDVDGDRMMQEDEIRNMLNDLDGKKKDMEHTSKQSEFDRPKTARDIKDQRRSAMGRGGGVSNDEFLIVTRRVDMMEHNILNIVEKIETVLGKLDGMERSKAKKKAEMGKMLDNILLDDSYDDKERSDRISRLVRDDLEK